MKSADFKVPPPSKDHVFSLGRDLFGNVSIGYRTRNHVDCVWGLHKGRELTGGHLDAIESWHQEGETLVFEDHPTHGAFGLVMGIPVTEITGQAAVELVSAAYAAGFKPEPKA